MTAGQTQSSRPPEPFRCPICKKPTREGVKEFPFCSERCRLLDLGKWLDGEYRVTRPLAPSKGADDSPESVEDENPGPEAPDGES